jgi:hypothetical protein
VGPMAGVDAVVNRNSSFPVPAGNLTPAEVKNTRVSTSIPIMNIWCNVTAILH